MLIQGQLIGLIQTESSIPYSRNQYMGFGLSGNTSRTHMIGADPVITWVDETTGPHAVDYFLTAYSQVG